MGGDIATQRRVKTQSEPQVLKSEKQLTAVQMKRLLCLALQKMQPIKMA